MNIDVNKEAVTPQIALDCGWFMVVNQDAAKELEEEIECISRRSEIWQDLASDRNLEIVSLGKNLEDAEASLSLYRRLDGEIDSLKQTIKELTHYRKIAEALEVEVDSLEQGIREHEKAFRAKGWDAGEEFDDKLWNLTK